MSEESTVKSHESFAQIGASHVQGATNLYGSALTHQRFVRLKICRSQVEHSLSRNWFQEKENLIEVDLSETQWATMISSLNRGAGVPCTIRLLGGKRVEQPPKHMLTQKDFEGQVKKEIAETLQILQKLREQMEQLLNKPSVRKSDVSAAMAHVDHALREFGQNMPFVVSQLQRTIEKIVAEGKKEVESYHLTLQNERSPAEPLMILETIASISEEK